MTATITGRKAKKIKMKTTSADQDKAYEIIEKHNEGKSMIDSHGNSRYISISHGKLGKMFTLWSFFSVRINQPFQYIGNLSNDLVTAAEKTIERYPNSYILVDQDQVLSKDENNGWMFLTFGKYKGCHIDDIIADDSSYAKWLLDNNMERYYEKNLPIGKLGKYIIQCESEINAIWKEYRTAKAKVITKELDDKFIGTIGEKAKFDVILEKIIPINSLYGFTELYIMKDKEGNKCIKFGTINVKFVVDKKEGAVEVAEGDNLQFTGMVQEHKVSITGKLGEKQTKIGRLSKFK